MHPCEERLARRLRALEGCSIHQYAGNPGTYPITIGFIDDSDAPNASNFNTAHQGHADRSAYTTTRIALAGWDWHPAVHLPQLLGGLSLNSVFGGAASYASAIGQFLFGVGTTGTGQVFLYETPGLDDDNTSSLSAPGAFWVQVGSGAVYTGANATARGCSIDPNGNGYWCAVEVPFASEILIQFTASASSAWSTKRTVASSAGPTPMVSFLGYLIYLAQNGIISSTSNQGSTFSDFNTGLGTGGAYVATNGTTCIFASGTRVWTSTDGVTWTVVALATGASHGCTGIAWDPTRSLFVCVQQHFSSPFDSEFWTSPDGLTWTESSIGPAGIVMADFAILQGDWVATLIDVVSGGLSQQIWSGDAGATWFVGRASFPSNNASATNLATSSRIVSSPQQLLSFNGWWARFSRIAGLPPTHL